MQTAKRMSFPDHRVLDIGCGWGEIGLYLAKLVDVEVVGVTLSAEQHSFAVSRAAAAGLADRVHFELKTIAGLRGGSSALSRSACSSMWVTDVEFLRVHYAKTLAHWIERFDANRDKIEALYDKKFARMWEFYLISAEMMFRTGNQLVFHMQVTRRRDAAPLTRDYITDIQRTYRQWDMDHSPPTAR